MTSDDEAVTPPAPDSTLAARLDAYERLINDDVAYATRNAARAGDPEAIALWAEFQRLT